MIVIELAELLREWGHCLSTNPGRGDQSIVGLPCAGWYLGGRANDMSPFRGFGYTNNKLAVARVAHFFLGVNIP